MSRHRFTPERLAKAYKTACMAELQAIKPGNVHVFADGHGMTIDDFIHSADVTADIVARPDLSLGERIYNAVEATQNAVGQNTNLGMLLLCVPIIDAALELADNRSLQQSLHDSLAKLTVSDAQWVAKAIALANPGGLGGAAQYDVHETPQVNLLEMMRAGQDKDRIAWQYANGFEDILGFGVTRYKDAMTRWENSAWAATALYLGFLTHVPDTHVVRKYGNSMAQALMQEAADIEQVYWQTDNSKLVQKQLLNWDASLKQRGINPGTSADLTVATLLADYLLQFN